MNSISKLLSSVALILSASGTVWAQSANIELIKDISVPSSRRSLFVDLSAYNRQPVTAFSGRDESFPLETLLDLDHVKTKLFKEATHFQTSFLPDENDCLGIFHEGEASAKDAVVIKKYYMQSFQENTWYDYVVTLVAEKDYASDYPDFDFFHKPHFTGCIFFSDAYGRLFNTQTYYNGRVLEAKVLKPGETPEPGDSFMFVDFFKEHNLVGKFCVTDNRDWDYKAQQALIKEVLDSGSNLPLLKNSQKGRDLVGEKFLDIRLPDPNGKKHRLSEYAGKGQWILVDFWASWCGPCKRAMPSISASYKKFHDKGFEIVGLSFDAELSDWKNAIETWDMPWIHLSDLNYWQSEAAKRYEIKAIPDNILIDPDGIIVARGLGGSELTAWLKEIYK